MIKTDEDLWKEPNKGIIVASASNWWASFDFVEFSVFFKSLLST